MVNNFNRIFFYKFFTFLIVYVDFYSINDLHGKFVDNDSQPGVDELTTYLKNAREKDDYAFFLSAGDMWQGGAESNITKGQIITDWMNELDFTSMTIGNHEFDWSSEYIKKNAEIAEFPFLAINIYDRQTNERVEYCDASVVVEAGGLQIGDSFELQMGEALLQLLCQHPVKADLAGVVGDVQKFFADLQIL